MALTEAEEKQLKDGLAGALKAIEDLKPLAAKTTELENTIKAKDAVITELQTKVGSISQDAGLTAIKTMCPDVPEEVLKALPEKDRPVLAKKLQDQISSKVASGKPATDPLEVWANAGSIAPTDEAGKAARDAEKTKLREEHRQNGNAFGMLKTRGSEIVAHLKKSPLFAAKA